MNQFQDDLQHLEMGDFSASGVTPAAVQGHDPSGERLCVGFCFVGVCGFQCANCFNCGFRCANCFNCGFRCANCFNCGNCFRCGACARCR